MPTSIPPRKRTCFLHTIDPKTGSVDRTKLYVVRVEGPHNCELEQLQMEARKELAKSLGIPVTNTLYNSSVAGWPQLERV